MVDRASKSALLQSCAHAEWGHAEMRRLVTTPSYLVSPKETHVWRLPPISRELEPRYFVLCMRALHLHWLPHIFLTVRSHQCSSIASTRERKVTQLPPLISFNRLLDESLHDHTKGTKYLVPDNSHSNAF